MMTPDEILDSNDRLAEAEEIAGIDPDDPPFDDGLEDLADDEDELDEDDGPFTQDFVKIMDPDFDPDDTGEELPDDFELED